MNLYIVVLIPILILIICTMILSPVIGGLYSILISLGFAIIETVFIGITFPKDEKRKDI